MGIKNKKMALPLVSKKDLERTRGFLKRFKKEIMENAKLKLKKWKEKNQGEIKK